MAFAAKRLRTSSAVPLGCALAALWAAPANASVDLFSANTLELSGDVRVTATDGSAVPITADTICLHGDGEHAVAFATRLRAELKQAGLEIRSFAA